MFHVCAVHFVDIDGIRDRIRASKTMDDEVLVALGLVKSEGPAPLLRNLDDWRQKDGLTFYRGRIYVPKNLELRREIVRLCYGAFMTRCLYHVHTRF